MNIIGIVYYTKQIAMQQEKLNEIKNEVQRILDAHLESEQRFSIQDLDEESTFLLIDLLLEQDDLEREKTWANIEKKLSTHQMNFEITYEWILEIKDKLNYLKTNSDDLNDLRNLVKSDLELDNQLNNI